MKRKHKDKLHKRKTSQHSLKRQQKKFDRKVRKLFCVGMRGYTLSTAT
ncbi:hypothetical protein [Sphingobacterium allocomposti]|nr:hypothetical protein [Sphingobacterium composti Yoo et al. 2007 non Ten et al. 2007]HLS95912.1 hypothetical protein [Sphingobacterium sp.]